MAFSLMPEVKARFFDANGDPLNGGKVFSYIAGSSTPTDTYTDSTGGTANANPVILDSEGYANIWLDEDIVYKIELKDSSDVSIFTTDNIVASGGVSSGDNKVKTSSSDPVANYLTNKIVAGTDITLVVTTDPAGDTITINNAVGGTAIWGGITGTLSNQTDLQAALDLKADLAGATFTGDVTISNTSALVVKQGSVLDFHNTVGSDDGTSLYRTNGDVTTFAYNGSSFFFRALQDDQLSFRNSLGSSFINMKPSTGTSDVDINANMNMFTGNLTVTAGTVYTNTIDDASGGKTSINTAVDVSGTFRQYTDTTHYSSLTSASGGHILLQNGTSSATLSSSNMNMILADSTGTRVKIDVDDADFEDITNSTAVRLEYGATKGEISLEGAASTLSYWSSKVSGQQNFHMNDSVSTNIFDVDTSGGYTSANPAVYLKGFDLVLDATSDIELGGDISYTGGADSSLLILSDTVDASDSKRILIGGGGSDSPTRGAYVDIRGNEFSVDGGKVNITCGDAVTGTNIGVDLQINGVSVLAIDGNKDVTITTGDLDVSGGNVDITSGTLDVGGAVTFDSTLDAAGEIDLTSVRDGIIKRYNSGGTYNRLSSYSASTGYWTQNSYHNGTGWVQDNTGVDSVLVDIGHTNGFRVRRIDAGRLRLTI